ncbi:hypothetical protein LTR37_015313 [Vermiconidia calcicola]|uniref:Uncharacterized protein n=1 Tax=Vermiconidia calcicola TaxID=1690605 RepID=A0ACC3MR94_9PEZI|nr:hypothetical protein LTR37_015313 [Vermiconidia calcicola]
MWSLEHVQWACIRAVANTSLYVRHSPWLSPTTQPDSVKTYQCRPNLYPCRVFTPRGHNGQDALPLVIRAHGGGFIVNNPTVDDPIARHLADNARCIVVSIDYGKAPQNKFPAAYEDVIAQSLAVIDDPDLPLDRSKVVLCGSSAGGNLLLAAAQDPRLLSKVVGVAAIYPVVDLTTDGDAKMATRPDASVPDFIGNSYSSITRLLFDAAQKPSSTDTRISPTYFATRDSLPPNVLLIGCEHDMFCHEDEAMANKLAALSTEAKVNTEAGWRAPGVQWHKVLGQPHAFEAFPAKTPEKEKARTDALDAMYSVISKWLIDVFSNSGGK